jgi:hypothetical protein
MNQLYESVNDIIEFHDKQEACILQSDKGELLEDDTPSLIRLYAESVFKLISFLEGRFRKVIWSVDSQDKISQELQEKFKREPPGEVGFKKILNHLYGLINKYRNFPEQLGLSKKAVWQLGKDIQEFGERGIGFRNWYAHGGWNDEQKQKIFGSESVELIECQNLYRDVRAMCLDFEKHIFNRPEKL